MHGEWKSLDGFRAEPIESLPSKEYVVDVVVLTNDEVEVKEPQPQRVARN